MTAIKTILHPTDFSESSTEALEVAHALARDHHAKLIVATIPFPPPPNLPEYIPPIPMSELEQRAKDSLVPYLKGIQDVSVSIRTHVGDPGPTIVAMAADCQADLIVMGTRGMSAFAKLLLGSVAQYVMRHAKCSVVTVKPGAEAKNQRQATTKCDVPAPMN